MTQTPAPIAIVGMSALLPGSPDLATYWRNIVDARDCLTDIPKDHSWSPADYYDADPATPDKTWATRGGFIDKAPFDPLQHGVIPVALEAIDSDQLLALIVARECLRDAGLDPDGAGWDRDRTSVILGHTSTNELVVDLSARLHGPTWRKAMARNGVPPAIVDRVVEDIGRHFPKWQEQSFPGMLANVAAGRIANRLDLGGTNATVDAACASSLGALHYAISELQAGRTDLALSGGTDTLNDIFMYMCFSKTPALSQSGDARPFDVNSDGIIISEGVAMFALKRLADAERDGDRVYAVIKGIGTSSDGRNKSIYAPASGGQVKAVTRAHAEAGFDLDTVDLIEAHGTGTRAGDLAEFNGLREVFSTVSDGHRVALGSVKSQIGHTKATAGAAGLMKVVLSLWQKVLPPTAKIERPNPKMEFEGTPLYLNTEARPWVTTGAHPRRAGVSAFGFGGTNYHFAVEEYTGAPARVSLPANEHLFLLGADSDEALLELIAKQREATAAAPTLAHAARAVLDGWAPGPRVVAFLADSADTLTERWAHAETLVRTGAPGETDDVRYAHPSEADAHVGVVFPGQGSQYVGMGRTAALRHPPVREAMGRAEAAMRAADRGSLFARIDPPAVFTDEDRKGQEAALRATEWAQPALGAVEVGLWNTLQSFGLHADAFAGHSYGELVALHAAGAYDEDTLWTLSRVRGEAMAVDIATCRGTMAAIRGALADIEAVIADHPDVVLANRNHPTQGVIAGTRDGVAAALVALEAAGLPGREIPVSAAFHSPLVADAREPLAAALAESAVNTPSTKVFANVTAAPYGDHADDVRTLLADQVISGVDWVGVIQAMVDSGVRTFVECGPKTVLSGLLKRCLKKVEGIEIVAVDAGNVRADGDAQLKRALAALACRGVAIDVAPLLAERLPEVPRTAPNKATVWVGGANVKRPETLNPPLPEPPLDWRPAVRASKPAARVHADGSVHSHRRRMPSPIPQTDVAGPPLLTAGRTSNGGGGRPGSTGSSDAGIDGNALASLLDATRQSLQAFQETQARTAEVHSQFLQNHARANESFAALFESHARLVELAAGGELDAEALATLREALAAPSGASVATPPRPTPVAATHDALADAIVRPTGLGRATTLDMPTNEGPHINAGDDLPPVLSARALSDMVKGGKELPKTTRVAPGVTPPAPKADIRGILLATVADKTGYPADLLDDGMDLESDLGVDSIKRVEILSAVTEALPGLPQIPDDELASLRTIGDIAARLEGASMDAPTPKHPEPAPPRDTSRAGMETISSFPTEDVESVVLRVVADKTGYPQDLLGVAMDLETDLGIDSIKRVEILSAITEAMPNLPSVPDDELAALRTLGDIIDRLDGPDVVAPRPASSPPAAPEPTAALDIDEILMAIVAQRTGYPADLLDPGMDLETDLGIDSIKRVEILSAVTEAIPGLPDLPEDELASARTLADIAALVKAHAGTAEVPEEEEPTDHGVDRLKLSARPARREVVVVPAPVGVGLTMGGLVVITRDRLGFADHTAAALREHGVDAHVIDPDWDSMRTVREALPARTKGVVHMAALGAVESDLVRRVRGGFLLAKVLDKATLFATVSGMGGTFGHERIDGPALQGALAGLTKTLAHERPNTRAVAIDVDIEAMDHAALAEELLTDRGVVEVGLHEEAITLDAVEVAVDMGVDEGPPVDEGDLVVVTGGARGVTAAVVIEMAKRWKPSLLLLGRSPAQDADPEWAVGVADDALKAALIARMRRDGAPFDPKRLEAELAEVRKSREIRTTVAAVEAHGAKAQYVVADVQDREAVRNALSRVSAKEGPVRGLVHGAGIIEDKLIDEKSIASFDRVFRTKVAGLDAVLQSVDPAQLKMAAVFSSVSGRYGNRGQVDYAMANEAITHEMQLLSALGVPRAKAFHWGPWSGGMVTPTLAAAFEARGMFLVGLDAGAAAFCDEFERGGPGVEVVIGGPDSAGALLGGDPDDSVPERQLSGSESVRLRGDQTFLDDHRIDGKPVLPFVMAVEFMADAAGRACPDLRFLGVRDVAVLKGVVLDNGGTTLTLNWSPAPSIIGAEISLAFELVGEPNKLGLPTVHYKGTVDLGARPFASDRFPGSNGLGADAYPYAVDEAYQRFLFHGPGFQGIEGIVGMSDHGIVGNLAASRPKRLGVHRPTWSTDPVTLDSALQLVGLWVWEHKGASALPSYVERYTQVAPFRGQVSCHIEMEPTRTARGRYQATFVDTAGRVVARIVGGQYTALKGLEDRYRDEG